MFCNILVWMIFFLILVLTNSVMLCTKPNLVYKAYDSRKEKRIGNWQAWVQVPSPSPVRKGKEESRLWAVSKIFFLGLSLSTRVWSRLLSVTKLQYYAYSHFSLQEMMTSVALEPTPRQVLSEGGYFLPNYSPVDNTFRSDWAHDPQAVWPRSGRLRWRRWLPGCNSNIVCHFISHIYLCRDCG